MDTPTLQRVIRLATIFEIRRFRSWSELSAAAAAAPAATALVDPCLERGGGLARELRQLLTRYPLLPVVVALPGLSTNAETARTVLSWGASEVLDVDLERSGLAILTRIRVAHARPLKRQVESLLGLERSEITRILLRAACEVAVEGGTVEHMAAKLLVHPRTLAGWCAREQIPAPRRLLAWTRILLGTALLKQGTSVIDAAQGSGYASDRGFRRAVEEFAGISVSGRRGSCFEQASAAFTQELLRRGNATRSPSMPPLATTPTPTSVDSVSSATRTA